MRRFARAGLRRFLSQPSTLRRPQRLVLNMASLWSAEHGSDTINLGKGHPNPSLLPLAEFREAFETASTRDRAAVTLMQYGRMQGNRRLCEQISAWLGSASGRPPPSPAQILVTTGSGPAMATICQLYTNPGDTVFVDSPAYFLSFYTFRDCGVNVVQVPIDTEGLCVDDVEHRLQAGERPSMLYTVPVANNPTGVSMSEERKRRLVSLSRQYGFKIAADEVYLFLSFADDFPTSLLDYDIPDNPTVFSINSFSKLLGPGLRLGWVATNEKHVARILDCGALQSGGGFNPLTSAVVAEMIAAGSVESHVAKLRVHYQNTCEVLCDAVDEYLRPALREGEQLQYHRPTGGFFLFITLPERFDAENLLEEAKKHGVSFFAGCHSSVDKRGFRSSLRLCFAFLDAAALQEAVRRLGEALRSYEQE